MVLADFSSSVMRSDSLADNCDSRKSQRGRNAVLTLALSLWLGRTVRIGQQARKMFELSDGPVVIVEQRLQQVGNAARAILPHQRTVVPQHLRLGSGEAVEGRVARLTQIAQDRAYVVKLVRG